jgi:hypothetical protein
MHTMKKMLMWVHVAAVSLLYMLLCVPAAATPHLPGSRLHAWPDLATRMEL